MILSSGVGEYDSGFGMFINLDFNTLEVRSIEATSVEVRVVVSSAAGRDALSLSDFLLARSLTCRRRSAAVTCFFLFLRGDLQGEIFCY